MTSRTIHRLLGLILMLPMLGWVITGIVFLTKPGYEGAYEPLALKTYPIDQAIHIPQGKNWGKINVIKTSLGIHYLVKGNGEYKHLHPDTYQAFPPPNRESFERLVDEAIQSNIERYGTIENVEDLQAFTSTGIEITLDWNTLQLKQYGRDRRVIETLYKIHYLQWTPWELPNRFMGVIGLFFLSCLTVAGIVLYCSSNRKTRGRYR